MIELAFHDLHLLRRDPAGIARVAALFRRLHGGPAFAPFIAVADAIQTMLARLTDLGVAPPPLREAAPAFPAIAAALARHAEPRPCHHDANPGNLLFDGERLWLVDWELAGAGDPFYDLGTLCVYAYPGPEERALLLASYLERPPTPAERARLAVATAQALAFYAVVFATIATLRPGAAPGPFPAEEDVPTLIGAQSLAPARGDAPDPARMGAVLAWELARVVRSDAHREALALL